MHWYKTSEKHPPVKTKYGIGTSEQIMVCICGSDLSPDKPPYAVTGYYTELPDGSYGRFVADGHMGTFHITHWAYIRLPKELKNATL